MISRLEAKHILNDRYEEISVNDGIIDTIPRFKDGIEAFFVFDEHRYLGILTHKMIVRSEWDKEVGTARDLVIPAPNVYEGTSVMECARLMIDSDVMHLPVFRGVKIVGAISAMDILASVARKDMGREAVKNVMSSDIVICSPDDLIPDIVKLLRLHFISRVPLVKDNELKGIISMHDIIEKAVSLDEGPDVLSFMSKDKELYKTRAEAIMTYPVETVEQEDTVADVVNIMLEWGVGAVLVVDKDRLPIGMVTRRDILEKVIEQKERTLAVHIHISSKTVGLDRELISKKIKRFVREDQDEIGKGHIYAYFKAIKGHRGKDAAVQCRLRIATDMLRAYINAEAFNEQDAIEICIKKFHKQFRL